MEIDESQAYAVAAWHRFDQEVTDDLLRAVAGAFALIACADGELAQSEVDGLVRTAITGEGLPRVDAGRLEALFRDVCQAMLSDVQDGRGRALDAMKAVAGDPQRAQLVAHAARLAMLADGRVRQPEQAALEQVCDALEVDPATLTDDG